MKVPKSGIVFAIVVALSLAQVAWWIVFQFRESHRFEEAARAFAAGDKGQFAAALGLDENGQPDDRFRRRRFMFATEGTFLGLCALLGIVFFYTALLRERRLLVQRERFLAGTAHEFKTPLATIRLGVETILDDRLPKERQLHYAKAMAREVDRLDRGVSNLLAASGLRDRRVDYALEEGDLVADLRSIEEEFRPRFEAANIQLEVDLPAGQLVAMRDRQAWRTAVVNLVDNALRYSDSGGSVRVSLRQAEGGIELRVKDDGRGLAADDCTKIFDPFYRGHADDHVGGSGLGLYLVREFVRSHSGSIEAHSDGVGHGSEFVLELPLAGVVG